MKILSEKIFKTTHLYYHKHLISNWSQFYLINNYSKNPLKTQNEIIFESWEIKKKLFKCFLIKKKSNMKIIRSKVWEWTPFSL